MARIEKVTAERLESTDHFRLQVNIDKRMMAFGYNILVAFLQREPMSLIRNQHATALEEQIGHDLAMVWMTYPAFHEFVREYFKNQVGDDVRAEGKQYLAATLRKHGAKL